MYKMKGPECEYERYHRSERSREINPFQVQNTRMKNIPIQEKLWGDNVWYIIYSKYL